ncbi:potassium-transporting ATPase subunit KdpC [Desulfuromonas sp. CSMB_57]|jgi:K+-transporting ATPase ATPase C chain|uniref:potassium-transporting ATPase subunit KdpC n=1 Tax=Desulfuromonas sp. CSMB_57 TaxID=2807629 RepID=UPI001CD4A925|nr:potassium-transporting ATPase subunit KdpC [Desulfuromonas sp. CSMB_57]
MLTMLRPALVLLAAFTVITGIAYPLVVTGFAQVLFPFQANGSIISKDGKPVGSALIGQLFDDPRYFWGRPSATTPFPYNGAASSGSNFGQANPALHERVASRLLVLRVADPSNTEPVPADLVTASASGLDPHMSPSAAQFQIGRVARSRGLDEAKVRALVVDHTEGRTFALLGEPRVNVLRLNLGLDELR